MCYVSAIRMSEVPLQCIMFQLLGCQRFFYNVLCFSIQDIRGFYTMCYVSAMIMERNPLQCVAANATLDNVSSDKDCKDICTSRTDFLCR